ncbi:hypothetical protein OTB20_04810 [Streptomyces sp. H27-H1]|uniref:hypothetical protein n=1 Tax=Streptomyces sp. H27-H1 TaxID=2996461 RepID=UPI002272299C|nr:hypothetical protein [Streptomyces sp. H27-H1]MCY0925536.1 hypothetical protein [Streptomyces sp. H27-H1]
MTGLTLGNDTALVVIDLQNGLMGLPVFAEDATADTDPESHAFGKIFPRIGKVSTTEEIVAALGEA